MRSFLTALTGLLGLVSALPSDLHAASERAFHDEVALTRRHVQTLSPSPHAAHPVSRRHQHQHHQHLHGKRLLPCVTQAVKSVGDDGDGSVAVVIKNEDDQANTYFFYYNSCDSVPMKYITIPARQSKRVSLCDDFQGRVVRGTLEANLGGKAMTLGTWVELTFTGQTGYGDVSLIRGCDGAAVIYPAERPQDTRGFTNDVLSAAPKALLGPKLSGALAIQATEDMQVSVNEAANYLAGKVEGGYEKTYIDDYHDNPVVSTSTGVFGVCFYKGVN